MSKYNIIHVNKLITFSGIFMKNKIKDIPSITVLKLCVVALILLKRFCEDKCATFFVDRLNILDKNCIMKMFFNFPSSIVQKRKCENLVQKM